MPTSKSKPAAKAKPTLAAKPKSAPVKKLAAKAKPAAKPAAAAKPAPAKQPAAKVAAAKPAPPAKRRDRTHVATVEEVVIGQARNGGDDSKLTPFLRKQREKLLALQDSMLDSMHGIAQDNLRSRADGPEASAFGMHQGDAGSDAYDRDFALSLLSQEQDALYEIQEAIKRIDQGTYGVCEMSSKHIPHGRLEAIPFTRFTVECQAELERQRRTQRVRPEVKSLFGLTDDEPGDGEEEETPPVDRREREQE